MLTRSRRLTPPTRTAQVIVATALPLLEREVDGRTFRLLGVGCTDLVDEQHNPEPDLFSTVRDTPARQ